MGRLATTRSVSAFESVVGFGSQIVDSRKCIGVGAVARVSLVPRIQSRGFDGGCHGHDGCSKGLVKDDVILKCSHCDDGVDQRLNVEL